MSIVPKSVSTLKGTSVAIPPTVLHVNQKTFFYSCHNNRHVTCLRLSSLNDIEQHYASCKGPFRLWINTQLAFLETPSISSMVRLIASKNYQSFVLQPKWKMGLRVSIHLMNKIKSTLSDNGKPVVTPPNVRDAMKHLCRELLRFDVVAYFDSSGECYGIEWPPPKRTPTQSYLYQLQKGQKYPISNYLPSSSSTKKTLGETHLRKKKQRPFSASRPSSCSHPKYKSMCSIYSSAPFTNPKAWVL
mmetsp:Transcript_4452/g.6532  ORF Transcript_4452/g.6532 Transcript_4452/m.6532 type:complete len:245 (-) Transcript_4452:880-1614(-)